MNEEIIFTEDYQPPVEQRRGRIVTGDDGRRHFILGHDEIANEEDDQVAAMARYVMAFPARPTAVAWIGGGFCIGPKIARGRVRDRQDVYEIRPQLGRFCPNYANFIPGDWRTTMTGTYDVIVYDLGGDVPRAELTPFLAAGGIILPAE